MKRHVKFIFGIVGVVSLVHLLDVQGRMFLTDDAYISFRYVQNFLQGRGLVFNPGERVEGYSNFLWVMQLIGLGKIGLMPADGSLLLSIGYSIGCLGLITALAHELVKRRSVKWVACFALLLTVTNQSWAVWTTGGLETRSNTFFILLGLWGAIRSSRNKGGELWGALGWACACLTRPDCLMLFGLTAIWHLVVTRDWRRMLKLNVIPGMAVAAHYLWRHAYYGDWLPNTYYAKVGEPWWDVGTAYLASAIVEYSLWLVILVGIAAPLLTRKRGTRSIFVLFGMLIGAQAVYLARIGGDHFEFRPLDFTWPLFYLTFSTALVLAFRRYAIWLRGKVGERARIVSIVSALVLVLVLMPYLLGISGAARVAAYPYTTREEATLRNPVITPEMLGANRYFPGIVALAEAWNRLTEKTISHAVGVRYFEHRINGEHLLAVFSPFEGLVEQGVIPADTTVAYGAVGIIAYMTDFRIVDLYGLTDRTIARTPRVIDESAGQRRLMAHNRMAPPGYLEERGVNVGRVFIWRGERPDLSEHPELYLVELGPEFYFSFTSPDPEWVQEAFDGRIIKRAGMGEE